MTATRTEAVDQMIALFATAWDPTGHAVDYENKAPLPGEKFPPEGDPPPPWARVSVRHGPSPQDTLADASGQILYDTQGFVTVQLFAPMGDGNSLLDGTLIPLVQNAFRRKTTPGNIFFRNIRANEIGPSGDFFQTNVVIDFTYDEIA